MATPYFELFPTIGVNNMSLEEARELAQTKSKEGGSDL